MSQCVPEMVADYVCECGEGPLWHPTEKRVYWTDIPTGRMFWYDPATGEHQQCYTGRPVGGFTLQADGSFLLFQNRGTVAVWRNGAVERTLIEELPDERNSRFNDVITDPEGRVFCGTMPTEGRPGRLYRLDRDGSIRLLLEGIGCANGMGFSPDRKRMYFTDSTPRQVYVFDYDRATGSISGQRSFVRTPEGQGVPDGMTVDAEGYVWSARWDGNAVFRYTPEGQETQRITLPALKVSSVIFGGEDYTDMYLTTAGGKNRSVNGQGAGALFRVRGAGRGVPEFVSRVGL